MSVIGIPSSPTSHADPKPVTQTTRAILAELFGPPAQRTFQTRLWDGSIDGPVAEPVPFSLVLNRPGALREMLWPPSQLAIADAYVSGDVDIVGNMEAATGLADLVMQRLTSPARLARLVPLIRALPTDNEHPARGRRTTPRRLGRRHTRRRDRAAVRSHYDVGNDFYALWLDRRMVYSCGYFTDDDQDLDTAQEAKLDHICRKLRLQPGERLLDIGCGWGGLVQYAAEHFGVDAVGITLSEPQAALAQERIASAGLSDRCRVEVRDYRELPTTSRFDKIASVGMVEHVGRTRLATYFDEVFRLLKPGGLFLNHGIVRLPRAELSRPMRLLWRPGEFIDRYVFPDGELVPIAEIIDHAEVAGFETRDVETLREHYARTLRHWVSRLEARHEDAIALVGEQTYRVWRLYMSGSARQFTTGHISIAQTLLSKPTETGASSLPLTRADVYDQHVVH